VPVKIIIEWMKMHSVSFILSINAFIYDEELITTEEWLLS